MQKRITASLLLGAMLISAASCGSTETQLPDDTTTAAESGDSTTSAAVTVTDWESSGLPRVSYDGAEFCILTTAASEGQSSWKEINPETANGDVLNDAIYARTRKIEELYNVKVTLKAIKSDFQAEVRQSVDAGDDAFQCTFFYIKRQLPLAQEGYYSSWYDMPYTDVNAAWWDQSVVEQLTVGDNLFVMNGDISPRTDSLVYSMVFNKDLCETLKLELPYQAVLDGNWTIDLFNKYISDVNYDVNGDQKMDYSDRWGFLSQSGNSVFMYFSGGGRVTDRDEKGNVKLVMNDERNIEMAMKALETTIDANKTLMGDQYVKNNGGSWTVMSSWFAGGGSLFRASSLEPVPRDYRGLDVNFGIVPFPKLDENQDRYYTLASENSYVWSVPVTADAEFVSLILEAMCVESISTVKPAFYDKVLVGKSVRDDESSAMLDILFENKVFDMVHIMNIGGFTSKLRELENSKSTDVVSAFQSIESTLSTALQQVLDDLASAGK